MYKRFMKKKWKQSVLTSAIVVSLVGTTVLPVMAAGPEDGLPLVATDQVVWDGSELVIPIDLGDYEDDDNVYMNLYTVEETEDSWNAFDYVYPTISKDKTTASVSRWDDYENCETEMKYSKAGTYPVEAEFYTIDPISGDYTVLSTDQLELVVKEDNAMWNVEYEKVPFDGSQDITIHFTNGTNAFHLKAITGYSIFAFFTDAMDSGELIREGFDFDMDAGTITFDKDVLKKAITDLTDDKEYISNAEVAFNVYALTEDGTEVQLALLDGGETSFNSIQSWWLDITQLDWNNEQPDEPETPQNPETSVPISAFDGVNFPGAFVTSAGGKVIADSALSFIQENYADKLAPLGDDYTVVSRLVLNEVGSDDVSQSVQEAFAGIAQSKNIGQYYDMSVRADIMKDGKTVSGLEDITVTNLKDDISISLNIPENLAKDGRTFNVLRYHDGQASVLETSVTDGVITFHTGEFSIYALAYADKQLTSGETENTQDIQDKVQTDVPETSNNALNAYENVQDEKIISKVPKTGDINGIFVAMAAIITCAGVVVTTLSLKRKVR